MKTKFTSASIFMLASLGMIISSCNKDSLQIDNPVTTVPTASAPDTTTKSASIVDLGLVDGTNRLFQVTFTNLDVLVNSSTEELPGRAGKISFELNSDKDGFVPTGEYNFDMANDNQPFTFNYGALKSLDVSGNISDTFIAGGSVFVSQDSTGYQLSFNCTLMSGAAIHGQYSGNVSYNDVE